MNNEINVEEAKNIIDNGAVVLDVRTKEEFESGHIGGSKNIDVTDASFRDKISELDKEKSYVVYCASGARSLSALGLMRELGFEDAHSMVGGISEWKKEGMEVVE
jgi:rhodanese-related sulfurtransferase